MQSKQYTLTAASLFTLLFVVSFLNNKLFSDNQTSPNLAIQETTLSSRLPASADVNWEANLIKKYTSGFRNQKNIVIGKRPDTLDKFTFGTLNGSYAINFSGGKISSLEFNKTQNSNQPQVIEDIHSFLDKNKDVLAVEFDSVAKINERRDGKNTFEEYGLFDSNLVKVATAEVKSDQDNRFLSLRIARDEHIASN